ncbi:hypothetical protein GRAQ_00314 [Rahnella aquatilis CIP 78.65 = ATCC 33071]|nr:hypothetical protein GRAQ_00314 [Rahnella aquatilis CIP 78.65 = ATCC 33071]
MCCQNSGVKYRLEIKPYSQTGQTVDVAVDAGEKIMSDVTMSSKSTQPLHSINKCGAEETAACCCVDVGTIMDNTDCTASYSRVFETEAQAKETLQALTERARGVESEPCEINSRIAKVDGGVELNIDFTFSCQAETMIFQLALR